MIMAESNRAGLFDEHGHSKPAWMTSPTSTTTAITLENLSDDVLSNILSHLDFASAVRWKELVSKSWKQRLQDCDHDNGVLRKVWEAFFHRMGFSSEDFVRGSSVNDIVRQCRYRMQLEWTLFARNARRKKNKHVSAPTTTTVKAHPFPLPNRLYSFVPILPDDWNNCGNDWWDDPPPVDFQCDSFVLTSTAVGGELLMLNPFSESLTLYSSVLDNAVRSDEGMMEHAIQAATKMIVQYQDQQQQESSLAAASYSSSSSSWSGQSTPVGSPEVELTASAFEQNITRNHSLYRSEQRVAPKKILIPGHFNTMGLETNHEMGNWEPWDHHPEQQQEARMEMLQFSMDGHSSLNADIQTEYMGIDSKPVLDKDGMVTGTTMLAVGRTIMSFDQNGRDSECMEIISWLRQSGDCNDDPLISQPFVCRVNGDFQWIELCASRKIVYMNQSVPAQQGAEDPVRRYHQPLGDRYVSAYSMEPMDQQGHQALRNQSLPNQPFMVLDCQHRVSSMRLCASGGRLVVATLQGVLQIWEIASRSLVQETCILDVLQAALGDRLSRAAESPIWTICPPPALSIEHCGFCTLQKNRTHGSTILFWQYTQSGGGDDKFEFQIHTMINLPLSAQRTPRMHYDGKRLIVFGQDHIGLIILVYKVMSTPERLSKCKGSQPSPPRLGEQHDGGVYDLAQPSRIRFVNRIRHGALGGIADYESLRMTCNERFIVVNTKTGNLLSDGTIPFHEGLLVIDLEDEQRHNQTIKPVS